jgi:hypothetical protein
MGSIRTAAGWALAIATLALAAAADAAAQSSWPNIVEKGRTSSSPPQVGGPDAAADGGPPSSTPAAGEPLQDRGAEPAYPGGFKPTGVTRRLDPFDRDEAEPPDIHISGEQEVIVCLAGCDGAPGPVGHGKQ